MKIEGVLSGTLSYIFNEFSTAKEGGPSFSSVVTIAREKGYTVNTSHSVPEETLLNVIIGTASSR